MNGKTGALAVVAAVAVLAAACGGSASSSAASRSVSAGSAAFQENVAFAQCMQTHGVPNFPVPTSSTQSFHVSGPPNGSATGPTAQAYNACQQLLPRGSATTGGGGVTQAELDLALKVVRCLRTHGAPDFPDPTVVNGSLHFDVDIQSPRYQAPLNACRSLLPKGVKLP
jgi:hypothetical protein